MKKMDTKYMVKAGVIGAIYVVLTVVMGRLSFIPQQLRISEALTILPFYEASAIPGLFVGCLLANIFGGAPFTDVILGSLATLIAAYATSKMPNKYLAVVPPIVINALIVPAGIILGGAVTESYSTLVYSIGFSEFLNAGVLGILLSTVYERVGGREKY